MMRRTKVASGAAAAVLEAMVRCRNAAPRRPARFRDGTVKMIAIAITNTSLYACRLSLRAPQNGTVMITFSVQRSAPALRP